MSLNTKYSPLSIYKQVSQYAFPEYDSLLEIREQIDDCLAGLRTNGEKMKYLKPTKWQKKHPDSFNEFLYRALFPFETKYSLDIYQGLFRLGSPHVHLPESLQYMLKNASAKGDGLKEVQVRLNTEQMSHGLRMMLLETRKDREEPFFIQEYSANKFISCHVKTENGETFPDIILLNESSIVNDMGSLSYTYDTKVRILALDGNGFYYQRQVTLPELTNFDYDNPPADNRTKYPEYLRQRYTRIPFVWCGASTTDCEVVDVPPLLPMAQKELKLFLCMAHNSQHIFMNTQEAVVITGAPGNFKIKDDEFVAGSVVAIPGENTKVQYLSTNGVGFGAEEKEIERLQTAIEQQRLSLMSAKSHQSGTVVGLVQNSQSAPLRTIVDVSGCSITQILRHAAQWMGIPRDEQEMISYLPSTEFADPRVNLSEFISLCKAVQENSVIMLEEDLFVIAKKSGYINNDFTWEQFKSRYDLQYEERQSKNAVTVKAEKNAPHPLAGVITPESGEDE